MNASSILPYLILLLILPIAQCGETDPEDLVDIPDHNFLQELIENGVDENGDGQISYQEAEATFALDLGPSNIKDLTGIEAFINLDSLEVKVNPLSILNMSKNLALRYLACMGCEITELHVSENVNLEYLDCSGDLALDNYLTGIDVSRNTALEFLHCAGNQITALDVSNNLLLKELTCGRNQIADLDVTGNTTLTTLRCNNNRLTLLDVTHNTSLKVMISCGNQLSSLDLSNNMELELIGIDNMPTLHEVCVWETPFPPAGIVVLRDYSPNAFFTASCRFP